MMWQAGLVFVGLTGLPHPEHLHTLGTSMMSALNINLDQWSNSYQGGGPYQGGGSQVSPEQAALMAAVTMMMMVLVPQILFALLYKSNVHDKKKAIDPGNRTMQSGNFHFGLFKCHENANECLCAMFCSTVRYADTYGSISGSFFGSMCTFFGVNVIIGCIASTVVVFAIPPPPFLIDPHVQARYQQQTELVSNLVQATCRGVFFGLMARKGLRAKLGDPEPGKNAITDCLSWGFCYCCALTQDSVEVDIALDVTVGCPCSVTPGRAGVRAREVAPSDYEALLEGGR
jgi:Cys-rich protein (TIGR01571 family)